MDVKIIAMAVRTAIVHWVKETEDQIDVEPNMCGACAISAMTLHRMLQKHGFESKLIHGRYIGNGFDNHHCWVELDDTIIDVTATQFGMSEVVFLNRKQHLTSSNYRKDHVFEGRHKKIVGNSHWRVWHPTQRPTPRRAKSVAQLAEMFMFRKYIPIG